MKTGLILFSVILLIASSLYALPQYTVEYRQSCALCHQNPTGGGMRNLYGAQFYSHMKLPQKPVEDFAELEKFQPMLNKNVQIGADMRAFYYTLEKDSTGNSFLTMQGDFYLAVMPTDKVMVYFDKSLNGTAELFGLIQGLPLSNAIRFGRFTPAYGWRFDNHKYFVRDKTGFSPISVNCIDPDNGVEIGMHPMTWDFTLAVTNGSPSATDRDDGKTITARGESRWALGEANLILGANYRYSEIGRSSPVVRYSGPFGGIFYKRLTYLGEVDWLIGAQTSQVATHLLSFKFKQGFDFIVSYDYYDPDVDLQNGYEWRGRLASAMFLTDYLEIMPAIEWNCIETSTTREYLVAEIQAHIWF